MIKALCFIALLAFACAQDAAAIAQDPNAAVQNNAEAIQSVVNDPVAVAQDNSQAVQDAVNQVVGDSTVAEVLNNVPQVAENNNVAVSDVSNLPQVAGIESALIGWGSENVLLTPSSDAEALLVERVAGAGANGEWALTWNGEDDHWAIWDQNGELVLVDEVNGVWNVVSNLGSSSVLGPQIASGAQQLVDSIWADQSIRSVNYNDLSSQAQQLVNNVVDNGSADSTINAWLDQQGQTQDSQVAAVVDSVLNNPQQAVDNAQNTQA